MEQQELFHIESSTDILSGLFPTEISKRTPIGYIHFILVMQGEAWVKVDGYNFRLVKGSFLFLLPNMLLGSITQTDDFLYGYLAFTFDYLSDFPLMLKTEISDQAINAPYCELNADNYDLIKRYFDFIDSRKNNDEVTKGLLYSLIVEVSRIYSDRNIKVEVSRKDELISNFFRLLHIHYKKEHSSAFYAGYLCVSDKYLMRTLKLLTGRTFHFWLSDFIVREAKLQLRSTDKSVTQIADELYFPNSSFFSRFFRRYTGMSPLQFRKGK